MCLNIRLKSKHENKLADTRSWNPTKSDTVDKAAKEYMRVAETDMLVYKGLHDLGDGEYASPYKKYRYNVGDELYQTNDAPKFSFTASSNYLHVNVGLHACIRPQRAYSHTDSWKKGVVAEFMIPKGTQYFIGIDDEIVCARYIFRRVLKRKEWGNR
jgi:hypothetical protein